MIATRLTSMAKSEVGRVAMAFIENVYLKSTFGFAIWLCYLKRSPLPISNKWLDLRAHCVPYFAGAALLDVVLKERDIPDPYVDLLLCVNHV